jgi:hypothetical protein
MKNLNEFKLFVRDNLFEDIKNLEIQRKEVLKKIITAIIIAILLGIFVLYISKGVFFEFVFFIGIFLVVSLTVFFSKTYRSDFKDMVIQKIINFVNDKLIYDKNFYIDREEFAKSNIFSIAYPNNYSGDDFVSGQIGDTKIKFSEINARHTTGTGKNRRTRRIFKGILFVADFNKNFKTKTIVLPDFAEKIFGFIGSKLQSMNKSKGQLIKLEDQEFEKHFVVYGEDQVESRYVLSISLMRRILDFKNKTKKSISISFIDNKIFIAIPYKKNLFEPKVFKTLYDFKPLQDYFDDLILFNSIVDDLNLNLRIWQS